MRKRIIFKRVFSRPHFPDGVLMTLPVDQFPCESCNINAFGFPKNDISLLRELSAKGGINNSRFEAAASRLNVIRASDNSKMTLEQLWQSWRPSWFQSPTEVVQFEKWYLEKYPFEKPEEVKTDEVVEQPKVVEEPVS